MRKQAFKLIIILLFVAYLTAFNYGGCGGDSSTGSSAPTPLPAVIELPDAPSALTATAVSSTQINLIWTDNSANEDGFKLERKTRLNGTYSVIAIIATANVTSYSDTGLVASTQYYYRVRAYNAAGNSAYSGEVSAPTQEPPPVIPYAPSSSTADAASSSQINLTWSNVNGEDGYKIERKIGADGNYAPITTIVGANIALYSDTGLADGTVYYYRVKAYNAGGDSAYSYESSAITPLKPTSALSATVMAPSQINLAWTNNSTHVTGFKVERKDGVNGTYAAITTIVEANITVYSDTGLADGTVYYYRVRAYNAVTNSVYGASASGATPVNPPSALSAMVVSLSQIDISWTDNSAVGPGFKIERKTGAGGTYAQIALAGAGITSYSNTGLASEAVYYYRVRAYNASGDSAYCAEASGATPINPPSALNTEVISSSQINLTWTDNSAVGPGFKIERKTGTGGIYAQIALVEAGITSYSDTGLTDGTVYYYRVRAYNASGDSDYSNEASPAIALNAPTGLAPAAVSFSQINLAWTDNSNNEDGFQIERKTGIAGTYAAITTIVGADIAAYSDTGLTDGTVYYYRVKAYNAIGDSAYCADATATTPVNPPSALNTAVVSSSQINLTWTDNSNSETGFKVERKTGIAGVYSVITTIAGAGITNYSNTGLTDGTVYYYRVRAYNADGNSAYCNETPGTTPVKPPSALNVTTVSLSQINLAWTDNSNSEIGFKVERKTGVTGTYAVITTIIGAGIASYSDTGLTDGTVYYYRVKAYNAIGDSAYSNESFSATFPSQVTAPNPANNATNCITTTQLAWTSASGATSYDVYFGTTSPGTFKGNQAGTSYNPGSLACNTPYYWRIDSKNAGGTTTGQVWSFTTQLAQPISPTPANNAINVITTTQLSWGVVSGATSYDVYFGTTSPGTFKGNQAGTSYDPGELSYSTPYYWRIDSKNAGGTTTGQVWSFTTQAEEPPLQVTLHTPSDAVKQWTKQFGVTGSDEAYGVATDTNGNIYVAGNTDGDLDGAGIECQAYGETDLFAVKYNSTGVKQWARQLGTATYDWVRAVAADAGGNIYVVGWTGGDLDGQSNNGGYDAFVVKYDSAGAKQWTRLLGTTSNETASGVAVSGGNIYVAGSTEGDLNGTNVGSNDLFVAKYNSAGVWQWTRQRGTTSADQANAVTTDTNGNIYVAGQTWGDLDGNTTAGLYDLFVLKYNPTGEWQWTRQLGSDNADYANGVAASTDGNIYLTGSTGGDLDGAGNECETFGGDDIFVVKYNAAGVRQWSRQFGTSNNEYGRGITTDAIGNIYIAGYTSGDLDGAGAGQNFGGEDLYAVKYDSAGVKQWTQQLGTVNTEEAYGVASDTTGNIYVAGWTNGDLDGNTNGGGVDLFVTKYSPDVAATDVSITQQLNWLPASGATSYNVYFGTTLTLIGNQSGTTYNPGTLAYSTTYYWRIDSKNNAGTTTGVVWSFTTQVPPPAQVTSPHPANGAVNMLMMGQQLSWAAASGAVSYDVYFGQTNPPTLSEFKMNTTDLSYAFGEWDLNENETYYWRIDSKNTNCATQGTVWKFQVRPWIKQDGSSSSLDMAAAIAVDLSGNSYSVGYTFGDLNGANVGGTDLFLVKYDSKGNRKWTRQLGTIEYDFAQGVAVDTSGNIYVAGYTYGDLDGTNAGTGTGTSDLFLVKYDSAGAKQWTRQLGTTEDEYAYGVAVDAAGNIYAAGATYGNLDGANAGEMDLFTVKYDPDGNWQWTKQLGTSVSEEAYSIAVDGSGNSYIAGYTYGELDGVNAGNADLFVAKYDSNGNWKWTRQLGTATDDYAKGVAVDTAGNIYAAGATYGSLDGANAGDSDIFVVKYNSAGVQQWVRQFGTSTTEEANGIAVDGSGNSYVAGYTYGGFDGWANAGDADIFVVKYDANGVKQPWTKQVGTSTTDMANGVAVDMSGTIYMAGYTGGALDGHNYYGDSDFFVAKWRKSSWTAQIGTSTDDKAYSIGLSNVNPVVVGSTGGDLDGTGEGNIVGDQSYVGGIDLCAVVYNSNGEWGGMTIQLGTADDDYAYGIVLDTD
ncbi:MAG: SBBP repeat-containing protein, partial [Planctomycetota bacterium]